MTNAVFQLPAGDFFQYWDGLFPANNITNVQLAERRALERRILRLRSKTSKLKSKICRELQRLQSNISSLSTIAPSGYLQQKQFLLMPHRMKAEKSKPPYLKVLDACHVTIDEEYCYEYELMTIEQLKHELEVLECKINRLMEQKGSLRGLKNEIDGLIIRIVHFTRVGLYKLEPMVRSSFHYLANICTVEKLVELLGFTTSFNSLTNIKWHTNPSLRLSPNFRKSASQPNPVPQNWHQK